MENGKTLTLENIKLEKGYDTRGDGGGVLVESGATLIMKNSSITGCTAKKHGGGVYVAGTFTMEGSSSIKECTAEKRASGVYVSGTFTMQDSSSIQDGDEGVTVSGTFTMKDSSSIQKCYEGVAVSGAFTMQGSSSIQKCTSYGVSIVYNGRFKMQDQSFIKDVEDKGVIVDGTFEMSGDALVHPSNQSNEVELKSGKTVTVTGDEALTGKPAARITPDSYEEGKIIVTGEGLFKTESFTLTDGLWKIDVFGRLQRRE